MLASQVRAVCEDNELQELSGSSCPPLQKTLVVEGNCCGKSVVVVLPLLVTATPTTSTVTKTTTAACYCYYYYHY